MPIDHSPPVPAGVDGRLAAYWPLDDGAGARVHDATLSDPADPAAATGTFDPAQLSWVTASCVPALAFFDSGASISAVTAGIADTSEQNPCTVYVAPGTYTERFRLPAWISLAGSGQDLSTITAAASADANATIEAACHHTIGQLTLVSSPGTAPGANVTALLTYDTSVDVRLDTVTVQGNAGDSLGSNIATLIIGGVMMNPGSPPLTPTLAMRNSAISADGRQQSGFAVNSFSAQVTATGCTLSGGFWAAVITSGPATFTLDHCTVKSHTIALKANSSDTAIFARGCQITGGVEGNVTVRP